MLIGLNHDMSPARFENARSPKELNWNSLTLLIVTAAKVWP